MKINESRMRQIIREEAKAILSEGIDGARDINLLDGIVIFSSPIKVDLGHETIMLKANHEYFYLHQIGLKTYKLYDSENHDGDERLGEFAGYISEERWDDLDKKVQELDGEPGSSSRRIPSDSFDNYKSHHRMRNYIE